MAKEKMSKAERQQLEADLATLRRAVTECEKELAADDEASKAIEAESMAASVKKFVDGGTGDERTATARGILRARENPHSIADALYGGDKKR